MIFTQFLRPNGRRQTISVMRPQPVEDMAQELRENGYKFEVEELMTGEIHMDVSHIADDYPLTNRICDNVEGKVNDAVDSMITEAHSKYKEWDKEQGR